MKKIYTLAIMALCVGGANAAVNQFESNREARLSGAVELESKMETSLKGTKKVATRADGWKSIGKGTYREGVFSSLFKGVEKELIEVELEQSENDPTAYRMVNPYANWTIPFSDVEYDATGTYYLNFNIEEVDGVKYWYMPEDYQSLGVILPEIVDGAEGMASLFTQVGTLCAEYGVARVLDAYGESCLGKYDEGVLTYPATMLAEDRDGNLREYTNVILHLESLEEGYGFKVNTKGQFGIAMPGVPISNDPYAGYTLIGEGEFMNPWLENFFDEKAPSPYKVTVYEDPNIKGSLRIKDAWGTWNLEENPVPFDITISTPECAIVDWQESGYVDELDGLGEIDIMSYSYFQFYGTQNPPTMAEFIAQYKEYNMYLDTQTNRIIMPAASMWVYPANGDNSVFGPQGENPVDGYIQLPADYVAPSAVTNIAVDNSNAPVEYFNIQGMRIANPEAGQMVIKRQGSEAVKMIVR